MLADHACHVIDRTFNMTVRLLARRLRIPGGVHRYDLIEPTCLVRLESHTQIASSFGWEPQAAR